MTNCDHFSAARASGRRAKQFGGARGTKALPAKIAALAWLLGALLAAACAAKPPAPTAEPTATRPPALVLANGYRPLQSGDEVEGATIDYQYILPSPDNPVVVLAFGQKMLNLVQVNPDMSDGFVAYVEELRAKTGSVLAFDEANPSQTTPAAVTFDRTKPVEFAFIPLPEEKRAWSATESSNGETRTGYKIVKRRDGGLRFVDAYDIIVLQSYNQIVTRMGNGTGLGFSARLAQLPQIFSDPAYQFGANAMQNKPPDASKYDPRVLKIDPNLSGIAQNLAWVLYSRNVPTGGIPLPSN